MSVINTLIIDTSTDKPIIIFSKGTTVLLKIELPAGMPTSRYLLSSISEGVKQLNFQINALAVSVGPGSYTGIRVGVAAAKGLAFPRSLPLVGFCSLEGFIPSVDGRFASLIEARLGGSYILLQERHGRKIIPHSTPAFIPKEELALYLADWPLQVGPHLCYPDAHHLAHLSAQKLAENQKKDLEILYLRTPIYRK